MCGILDTVWYITHTPYSIYRSYGEWYIAYCVMHNRGTVVHVYIERDSL